MTEDDHQNDTGMHESIIYENSDIPVGTELKSSRPFVSEAIQVSAEKWIG